MLDFPARTLMRFWFNHGFLGMDTRHPWWTVVDGSRQYVRKLIAPFRDRIRLNTPVQRVERRDGKVIVHVSGQPSETYDKVILATHAPTSLALLADPTPLETELLSRFRYQPNLATLHTDTRFMPRERRCWAAWNYRVELGPEGALRSSTHYWMNRLQGVSDKTDYLVSINAPEGLDESRVIRRIAYEHPLFDLNAVHAQARLPELNRLGRDQTTYYCGAWFRYGFHEDGLLSAVNLCRDLLGEEPW
jgi:predicted NAD/FAD-binding protein